MEPPHWPIIGAESSSATSFCGALGMEMHPHTPLGVENYSYIKGWKVTHVEVCGSGEPPLLRCVWVGFHPYCLLYEVGMCGEASTTHVGAEPPSIVSLYEMDFHLFNFFLHNCLCGRLTCISIHVSRFHCLT